MASSAGTVLPSVHDFEGQIKPTLNVYVCVCVCLFSELNLGQKLNEGKTKQIFEIVDQAGLVLVQSKDQITAGNAVRKDQMEGKAAIANKTTSCVFKLLQESGENMVLQQFVKSHQKMVCCGFLCRLGRVKGSGLEADTPTSCWELKNWI